MDPIAVKFIISVFAVSFVLLLATGGHYVSGERWAERLNPILVAGCYASMFAFIFYFIWTR
jgi:hypothetical protein